MAWKHPTVEERGADGCRSVNNRETRWEVDPGIGHRKKSLDLVDLSQSQKQQLVEALRTDYSIRQVCDTLGLNRSSLYYEPKRGAPEEILRSVIDASPD